MESGLDTPGSLLTDEEYKEMVVQKYGDIRGLAETLLFMRKSRHPADDKKGGASSVSIGEDIINYRNISTEAERARKSLNRLCLRIRYAEKSRSFGDIPYLEIKSALEEVCGILAGTQRQYVEPCLERQKNDLALDYLDY